MKRKWEMSAETKKAYRRVLAETEEALATMDPKAAFILGHLVSTISDFQSRDIADANGEIDGLERKLEVQEDR